MADTQEKVAPGDELVKLAAPLKQNFTTPGGTVLKQHQERCKRKDAEALNLRLEGDEDEGLGAAKPTKEERAKAKKLAERGKVVVSAAPVHGISPEEVTQLKLANEALMDRLAVLEDRLAAAEVPAEGSEAPAGDAPGGDNPKDEAAKGKKK